MDAKTNGALVALGKKWREESDAKYPRKPESLRMSPDVRYEREGRCEQLEVCADELDALLAALSPESAP
jgi:hypothetical protein